MFLNGLITNDMKNAGAESLDAGGVSECAGTFDRRGARDSREWTGVSDRHGNRVA